MANKKEQTKKNFWKDIFKYKKLWIVIIGLVIIVPLICITALYINTYKDNKPTVFSTHAEVKVEDNFKDFDFDCYASEINYAKLNEDKEVTTSGKITLKARAVNNDKTDFKLTKIMNCQIMYASNWINYASSTSTITASTIKIDEETYTSGTSCVIDKSFPQKPLWFVNIKSPTLYVYLQYQGKFEGKEVSTYEVILEIPYNEYFSKTKTIINDPNM